MGRSRSNILLLCVLHLLFVQVCHSAASDGTETDDDKLISLLLNQIRKHGDTGGSQVSQILQAIEAAENMTTSQSSSKITSRTGEDAEYDEVIEFLEKAIREGHGIDKDYKKLDATVKRSDLKADSDEKKVVTRSNYHDDDDHGLHDHSSWGWSDAPVVVKYEQEHDNSHLKLLLQLYKVWRSVVVSKVRLRKRLLIAKLRALKYLIVELAKLKPKPQVLVLKDAHKGWDSGWNLWPSLLKTTPAPPVTSGWSSSSWSSDPPPGWEPETTPKPSYGVPPSKYSDFTSYSAPPPPKNSDPVGYSSRPPPIYSDPTSYSAPSPPKYSDSIGYSNSAPPPPKYSDPIGYSYSTQAPPKYQDPGIYSAPPPPIYSDPTSYRYNTPAPPKYSDHVGHALPKYSEPSIYSAPSPPSPDKNYGPPAGYEQRYTYQHAAPPSPHTPAPPIVIAFSSDNSGSNPSQLLTAPSDHHQSELELPSYAKYLRELGIDPSNLETLDSIRSLRKSEKEEDVPYLISQS